LDEAVSYSPVPVINAGAGSGEHPTQALLDVYTIWRELGRLENMTVAVLGDLKYGRTVHSLLRLLTRMQGMQVKLYHPPMLGLPAALLAELEQSSIEVTQCDSVADALKDADIVYQTRIQSERLEGFDEQCATDDYAIHVDHLLQLPAHARILHPLPRVGEIDPAIDPDLRAAYFRQAENGLYVRMALLDQILNGSLT
jgi:aspartate carbamoyltransferase catalytic subunit